MYQFFSGVVDPSDFAQAGKQTAASAKAATELHHDQSNGPHGKGLSGTAARRHAADHLPCVSKAQASMNRALHF